MIFKTLVAINLLFILKLARLSDVLISTDNRLQILFSSCLSDFRPYVVELDYTCMGSNFR